ncbi:helix-hairpin-helix domain-containing protein [Parapedobacter sp. ISTM3]|uniref:DNA uptake protein ComE n=1 Tax=Parapedobacter luteus TaxID=623280 RepID=A0A1T5AUW6_9SPHI|nr:MULTISPECIES: helix-hairpin-helix domain-containing protein [Parapedobacter]MBK1440264.1 helix-hairpin-helix domain-containing protein [Parapedobacter sp. ISTM3]SKB38841.1 DNA uptake protein ComE [Parapedobacter luteus]
MSSWFEKFFAFSRSELRGIGVLAVLLLAMGVGAHIYRSREVRENETFPAYIDTIERFLASVDRRTETDSPAETASSEIAYQLAEVDYFPFDPNGLAVVAWKRLGLSDRQIRMIKNYEAKGGRFRKKEDLKKIYAISESDYARLEPYIHIRPATAERPATAGRPAIPIEKTAPEALYLDLNTADSLALQALPGIGPVYASRIVRFRDRLGGFHQVSQLMDVYGFDTLRFDGLKDHVFVDTAKVAKIALNMADYAQLSSHPLIGAKLANLIVQYRKQHGPYRTLTDLLDIAIIDEEIFRKIVPYLTIAND